MSLVHMQSSGKLTKYRSESASEVTQSKESTDLQAGCVCQENDMHLTTGISVDFRPSKAMRGRLHHME